MHYSTQNKKKKNLKADKREANYRARAKNTKIRAIKILQKRNTKTNEQIESEV